MSDIDACVGRRTAITLHTRELDWHAVTGVAAIPGLRVPGCGARTTVHVLPRHTMATGADGEPVTVPLLVAYPACGGCTLHELNGFGEWVLDDLDAAKCLADAGHRLHGPLAVAALPAAAVAAGPPRDMHAVDLDADAYDMLARMALDWHSTWSAHQFALPRAKRHVNRLDEAAGR